MTLEAIAPDGSPVPVFRALAPGAAPERIHGAVGEGTSILDLGCGAGRLASALTDLGHAVIGVDLCPSMLEAIDPRVGPVCAEIAGLDLGRTFGGVLLASYLINHLSLAPSFLETCRRHVAADGAVIVQRYDPHWAREGFADVVASGNVTVAVYSFHSPASGDEFSAVVTYTVDGQSWDQPITARILDDDAVATLAGAAGLRVDRWLDEHRTWVRLVPDGA